MSPPRLAPRLHRLPPMLHSEVQCPMTSCSKGAWGLSVLLRVGGIFTATSISPSLRLRQRPSRYAVHARRNLPDKELRYLRTVIVTAAVYRGFGRQLPFPSPAPLTYRHRAGVRLYTSSCELAESCVFDKQSLEPILCGSPCGEHPLYRGYGVILPSSFTRVLPNAFGSSPGTPVSDCGTGRCFVRGRLFVAAMSWDFQIECCRPCGTGASITPTPHRTASPATQPP